MNRWIKLIGVLSLSLLIVGCIEPSVNKMQEKRLNLPAITKYDTNKHYSGKFVWHDLITDDVSGAKRFYGALFGWTFEDNGNYIVIMHDKKPIGGMMKVTSSAQKNVEALWLPSISVANVDNAVKYVKKHKGKVIKGPLEMEVRGKGALVSDVQGAHFVLLHSKTGDPLDATPQIGDWLWNELWTNDGKTSYNFYRELGHYDRAKEKNHYRILTSKGKWRAGIRTITSEKVKTHWVPVIRVADPKSITNKVLRLGGKVLFEPNASLYNGNVAVIVDNAGALVIVQRWTKEQK